MNYSPGYFCPPSLRTKLAVRLQEAEETAESVQAWVANTEKTKQRLQNKVEYLTVHLEKARNPAIQECIQHKLDQQDLRPGTGSPGSLSVNSGQLWTGLLFLKILRSLY